MQVLLVHGLWRTPASMLSLSRRLRREGYVTRLFGYAAVAEPYERIVRRLADRIGYAAELGPYSIVGYSLGGVLLRDALSRMPAAQRRPERIVFLGTPNRAPRMASLFSSYPPYRWITGECGVNLATPEFYAGLAEPPVPYTIVAGTRGPRGRWSPFGERANDGLVGLEETRIHDDDPVVELPVTHAFMLGDARVHQVVVDALRGQAPAARASSAA